MRGNVLFAVAVGLIVLVAAKGVQLLLPAADLPQGWIIGTRIAGVALVAVGVVGLLRQRAQLPGSGVGRGDPTVVGLRAAATIMGVVALLALFNPPPPRNEAPRPGIGLGLIEASPWGSEGGGGGTPPRGTRGGESLIRGEAHDLPDAPLLPQQVTSEGEMGFGRRAAFFMSRVFLLLAALLALRYLAMRYQARRRVEWDFEPPVEPADAYAGLSASLEEIRQGGAEPRGQISRAYARLLEALEAAGAPRESYEAPHEHLNRALRPLGVRDAALHRLAGLYVLAQFGDRPITDEHRAAAAEALAHSLDDLRAVLPSWKPRRIKLRGGARA